MLAESCGRLSESALNYEDARRQLERVDRGFSVWGLSWQCALSAHAASALQLLGRSDEATKVAEDAMRRAHESTHLFSLGHTLSCVGGWLCRIRREPQLGLAYADETIALAEEHGFAEWLPWGRFDGRVSFGGPAAAAPTIQTRGYRQEQLSLVASEVFPIRASGNVHLE